MVLLKTSGYRWLVPLTSRDQPPALRSAVPLPTERHSAAIYTEHVVQGEAPPRFSSPAVTTATAQRERDVTGFRCSHILPAEGGGWRGELTAEEEEDGGGSVRCPPNSTHTLPPPPPPHFFWMENSHWLQWWCIIKGFKSVMMDDENIAITFLKANTVFVSGMVTACSPQIM